MSAVNLWKRSQLQRELRDAGFDEKWRFVGIAESGVRHCFRVVKSATSSTRLNRISASFAKHIHTINLHFCARKHDERALFETAFFEIAVGCQLGRSMLRPYYSNRARAGSQCLLQGVQ